LLCVTSTAFLKSSFSALPIIRKSGTIFQQVLSSHEPDMPWHLQRTCMLFANACKQIADDLS